MLRFGKKIECSRALPFLASIILVAVFAAPVASAEGYMVHDPIVINGNGGFTAQNGVVQGDGSESNPFVICGWDIDATGRVGIRISYTTAHFVITGVNIHSSQMGTCVYASYVSNGDIIDNTFSGADSGVLLSTCKDMRVVGNRLLDNWAGVAVVYTGSGIVVSENEFMGTMMGLTLTYVTGVTVTDNTFVGNGLKIEGYRAEHYDSHTISGNTVNGLPIGLYVGQAGITISDSAFGQLIVASCTDVTISGLEIRETTCGMQLGFVTDALITGCTVSSCRYYGISMSVSSGVEITSCNIESCRLGGLMVSAGVGPTVSGCLITGCGNAVLVYDGVGVELESNTIRGNSNAIYFASSSGCAVRRNQLDEDFGGTFLSECEDVVVEDNVFSGIGGLVFGSCQRMTVQRNTFVHHGLSFWGDTVEEYNSHTVVDNLVNGLPLRYYKDVDELVLAGAPTGQLILVNCRDVQVKDVKLEDVDYALQIVFCEHVTVKGCRVSVDPELYAGAGVWVERSMDVAITGSTVDVSWGDGILLWYSGSVELTGNIVVAEWYGISVTGCDGVTVVGNRIWAGDGIGVDDSQNVILKGNKVTAP